MTPKQLKKIARLVPFFTSEDGTDYTVVMNADGDNGWDQTWYVWNGSDWETICTSDVPDEVILQFDPYC